MLFSIDGAFGCLLRDSGEPGWRGVRLHLLFSRETDSGRHPSPAPPSVDEESSGTSTADFECKLTPVRTPTRLIVSVVTQEVHHAICIDTT